MSIWRWLSFGVLVLVASCGRGRTTTPRREPAPINTTAPVSALPDLVPVTRPVYPYSIVPGGIGNRAELKKAIQSDRLVAEHYGGVNPDDLKPVKLEKDTEAFVSYRYRGRVYWTARKVKLSRGETIFEGPDTGVRGRCGNQISTQPRLPVLDNKQAEPTSEVLNTPLPIEASPPSISPSAAHSGASTIPLKLIDEQQAAAQQPLPTPSTLGWSIPGAVGSGLAGVNSGGGGGAGGGAGGGIPATAGAGSTPILINVPGFGPNPSPTVPVYSGPAGSVTVAGTSLPTIGYPTQIATNSPPPATWVSSPFPGVVSQPSPVRSSTLPPIPPVQTAPPVQKPPSPPPSKPTQTGVPAQIPVDETKPTPPTTVITTPEPGSMLLILLGVAAMIRRRKGLAGR